MNRIIDEYSTLVFDCDGVILNSNKIKTQAFFDVAVQFGPEYAEALVDYHIKNGGISRIVKFQYFIKHILGDIFNEDILEQLLVSYGEIVKDKLIQSEVAKGLDKLREKTKNANWLIVSGGSQSELREVFSAKNIDHYFTGGIYGNPEDKDTILEREINRGNIVKPALFIGDSKYDYIVSKNANLDFLFLWDWTELEDYEPWCLTENIESLPNLSELVHSGSQENH